MKEFNQPIFSKQRVIMIKNEDNIRIIRQRRRFKSNQDKNTWGNFMLFIENIEGWEWDSPIELRSVDTKNAIATKPLY